MTDLLDKFKSVGDFSKLQIHVIFNYMPFTEKINETEKYSKNNPQISQLSDSETGSGSSSFTPEFITKMIGNTDNKFNFSTKNNPAFLLDTNISKEQLESLLPELNKVIEKFKEDDKLKDKELKAINENDNDNRGGTRITKRQKKTPLKRNKHHTAKKHT